MFSVCQLPRATAPFDNRLVSIERHPLQAGINERQGARSKDYSMPSLTSRAYEMLLISMITHCISDNDYSSHKICSSSGVQSHH